MFLSDMHNIIEARQKNEVEGIVLQRFGRECCRIYRLLAIKGQLEQKQVRCVLYTLLLKWQQKNTYSIVPPDWGKSYGAQKCEGAALPSAEGEICPSPGISPHSLYALSY